MISPRLHELPPPPEGRIGWPWTEENPPCPQEHGHVDSWPLISVVTPSYNQASYVEETIRSVLLQGYPRLEYIVMDGGSTDGAREIIRRYEPWITYWASGKDGGQANAINSGFEKATGDIYAYLNSDDIYERGALQHAALALRSRISLPAIVSFSGHEWDGNRILSKQVPKDVPELISWLDGPSSLFQPSCFWTAELHRRLGGFKASMHFCFDKEFFIRALFWEGEYLPRPDFFASRFRIHPASKTCAMHDWMVGENAAVRSMTLSDERVRRAYEERKRALVLEKAVAAATARECWLGRLLSMGGIIAKTPSSLKSRFFLGALRRTLLFAKRDRKAGDLTG